MEHLITPDCVIHQGDVRDVLRRLPDESVHCVVTSPPYWGLRDYGTAQWEGGDPNCRHEAPAWANDPGDLPGMCEGGALGANAAKWARRTGGVCPRCGARRVDRQIGLEPTPEEYVATMVEVFREVKRVLRKDGTLWLNLGDSYNGSGGAGGDYGPGGLKEGQPRYPGRNVSSLKPKDLVGIPWRVAFALQADGWYLRSDIIWSKPNPMPESVTDRPTKSHEYVFLLSKSPHYYYDADAIREPHTSDRPLKVPAGWDTEPGAHGSIHRKGGNPRRAVGFPPQATDPTKGQPAGVAGFHPAGRNRRSVWTIPTQPFPDAHFATFPEELPRLCILAGTSPMACPHCGAPWRRVVERYRTLDGERADDVPAMRSTDKSRPSSAQGVAHSRTGSVTETIGWQPTCSCEGNDGSGRCVVLDPFAGSGTTLMVALQLGRAAIGIELNPDYIEIARRRINGTQLTLIGQV